MKLPGEPIISPNKLIKYLLLPQEEDYKSKYLNEGGYLLSNWQELYRDLIDLSEKFPAKFKKKTIFGDEYIIQDTLSGRNGCKSRKIYSVWYYEKNENVSRFITLRPLKKNEELK